MKVIVSDRMIPVDPYSRTKKNWKLMALRQTVSFQSK